MAGNNMLWTALQAMLLFAIILSVSAYSMRHTMLSQPQHAGSNAGGNIYQYDYNSSHVYYVDTNVSYLDMNVGSAIIGTPTLYNGNLIITTMGNLYVLERARYDLARGGLMSINMSTGRINWQREFPNQIMGQPIVVDNVIYIGEGNNAEVPKPEYLNEVNGMFAINATTGETIWNFSTDGPEMPTPAFYNGNLIEPATGWAMIINASSGTVLHSTYIHVPDILSSPLLVDGVAYFGAGSRGANGSGNDYRFMAMNATNGNLLWTLPLEQWALGGINDVCAAFWKGTVVTGYLYKSDYDNPTIIGVNASTGKILWFVNETSLPKPEPVSNLTMMAQRTNFTENTMSPITILDGVAFADSNFYGVLFAINVSDGKVLWTFNTGPSEANPTVFGGHYLAIVNDNGIVYSIDANDGKLIRTIDTGGPHLSSEMVVTNNYLIMGSMDGRILTIPVNSLLP
ncbi:MAG: PQQ-binding-like beta-propeller repeat protein [Candidatus Micrarchaeota archaeon]|nr:PQQ-binding-like beta-propeller repeat protein [Candidatus Micrarchaeota archaeon]MDE1851984.1 PQQ-binding-like beta-propeller repeat protein [Candidatus Micrarchaeota archaeon]